MARKTKRSPTRTEASLGRGEGRDAMRQRILATVDSIPRGSVATYGQVAREAGLPGRARLVGRVLAELPASSGIPWQRVVGSGGKISLAGPSARRQSARLRKEGVAVDARGRIDLARFGWRA